MDMPVDMDELKKLVESELADLNLDISEQIDLSTDDFSIDNFLTDGTGYENNFDSSNVINDLDLKSIDEIIQTFETDEMNERAKKVELFSLRESVGTPFLSHKEMPREAKRFGGKRLQKLNERKLDPLKKKAAGIESTKMKKEAGNIKSNGFDMADSEKTRSAFSKVMGIVFDIVFYAALIAIVAGSTIFAFSKDPGKSYFGYRFYNVLSNSMVPNKEAKEAGLTGGFKEGDLILIRLANPEEIEVGDIITFTPDLNGTAYLTHRVVEVKTSLNDTEGMFFVTRGDANNTEDPPISAEMVIGKKVAVIPCIGTLIEFVRNNFIPVVIFIVAGFGLIIVLRLLFSKPKETTHTDP